jgi:hypothetical protein
VHGSGGTVDVASRAVWSGMRRVVGGTVLLALGGCGGAAPAVVVSDSAGVTVVDNALPADAGRDTPGYRVGTATWTVGAPSAGRSTGVALNGVVAAFPGPGSRLAVVEESGRVLLFEGGRLVTVAGGPGEGPGEYRLVAGAGPAGDSLWIYDFALRRITYVGWDGALLGTVRIGGTAGSLLPVGRLPDGGMVLAASYDPAAAAAERRPGLRRDTVPYVIHAAAGQPTDTLGRFPAREYVVGREDGRATMASPLFARAGKAVVADGAVVYGSGETREIRWFDPSGRPRRIARWRGPDLEADDADVEAALADRLARHGNADAAGLRRFLLELPRPATRPAHGRILADGPGVWVAEEAGPAGGDEGAWLAFDGEGRWRSRVAMPDGFSPLWVGPECVVGVWRDALDVEHVQVRPLSR